MRARGGPPEPKRLIHGPREAQSPSAFHPPSSLVSYTERDGPNAILCLKLKSIRINTKCVYDLSHPLLKAQYHVFSSQMNLDVQCFRDLCLLHSAQVPAALDCVLCFPWTQPGLKAFHLCGSDVPPSPSCLSHGAASREPPRKAHVVLKVQEGPERLSFSPISTAPWACCLAPLAQIFPVTLLVLLLPGLWCPPTAHPQPPLLLQAFIRT